MYLNKEKAISKISEFLSDYINKSSQKNFFIIYYGFVSDWLTIKLCEEARKTCSANIYFTDVSNSIHHIDFDFAKQISFPQEGLRNYIVDFCINEKCLAISSLNINKGIIHRSFNKHNHIGDLYPILDLYQSECIELANYLNISKKLLQELEENDLKFDFNKNEFEFCHKENIKNNIITSDVSPLKHPDWFKYTKLQKDLIAKLNQREKLTRHKDLISRGALFVSINKK